MDGFKTNFVQYLRDNNLLNKVDLNKNDNRINIQKYDDQFTDFLKNYRVDENELIEASIDVNEILSMDFNNIANVDIADNEADGGKDVIGGLFNFLINQNDIKAQVDKNGDGAFSKDEIAEFAKTVASKDGDNNNFTLKDMLDSYQQMNNKEFQVGDFTQTTDAPEIPQGTTRRPEPPKTPQTYEFMETGSVTNVTPEQLANSSEKELKDEKENQQGLLNNANANMEAALSGASSEVQPSNGQVNSDYEAYLASVGALEKNGEKYSTLISAKNTEVTEKQNQLHTWQLTNEADKQAVETLDIELQSANEAVKTATNKVSSIGEELASKLASITTSNEADAISAVKKPDTSALESALDNAKEELNKAEKEQEAKQKEYDDAVNKEKESANEVERHQKELGALNNELTKLQKEAAEAAGVDKANVESMASAWNQSRADNEQSRQSTFNKYSGMASAIVSNIGTINNAIADVQAQEANN